jgi:ribokinase
MNKITVVGSYIVALVMDTERIPVEGETVIGHNYHVTHGGKGSNMAAAAARLGADASFVGKIGRDHFGEDFLKLLDEEGVNGDGVLYSDAYPTAVGIIIFSKRGSNIIVIDLGACGDFTPDDVRNSAGIIEASDVILSPLEIPLETALEGARIAHAGGMKAVLNPAPAVNLRNADLTHLYALTPNENEARVSLGLDPNDRISDGEAAERLFDLGVENVIITLGEKGVLWKGPDGIMSIPSLKVDVVDTVGAGDAFNAGLVTGLAENRPLPEAIALGVTAASLSTQKRETIESYPRREEVDRRIGEVLSRM